MSLNDNIFNSNIRDQLAHCIRIPCISKEIKAHMCSTTFAKVQYHTSFLDIDTMSIDTHCNFNVHSQLLPEHKDSSICPMLKICWHKTLFLKHIYLDICC